MDEGQASDKWDRGVWDWATTTTTTTMSTTILLLCLPPRSKLLVIQIAKITCELKSRIEITNNLNEIQD